MPWPAVAEMKLSPAGSASVTRTPVALLGPLSRAVMVKVTFWPTLGVALLTLLVTAMSADWPFTLTEAVSLEGLGSGWSPALRAAVLVMFPA